MNTQLFTAVVMVATGVVILVIPKDFPAENSRDFAVGCMALLLAILEVTNKYECKRISDVFL
jgi:hypothetical protein